MFFNFKFQHLDGSHLKNKTACDLFPHYPGVPGVSVNDQFGKLDFYRPFHQRLGSLRKMLGISTTWVNSVALQAEGSPVARQWLTQHHRLLISGHSQSRIFR